MKNFFTFLLLNSCFTTLLSAQDTLTNVPDTLWRTGGMGSLNLSQIGVTNWAAGGENALSGNIFVNLFANYAKGKVAWDNYLDLGYGLTKQGEEEFIKNDDRFECNTKFGYKIGESKWFLSALAGFKSQFAEGFALPDDSTVISDFASPAYVILSLGLDFKPDDHFSLYVSPFTYKFTIVNNQDIANTGTYGNKAAYIDDAGNFIEGEKEHKELGAYLKIMYNRNLMDNVSFQTKLDLFSNYDVHPEHVDVNWEILIGLKVNEYISATISTQLIYDHDILVPLYETINDVRTEVGTGPRTQFKEVFGIGLSYKFSSYSVK
ncbi:MAG: DUF3078 domain-containing protein [Bacteroidia bacterium]